MLDTWRQDYSIMVSNSLRTMWENAIVGGSKGQPILDNLAFEFNSQTPGINRWINERAASFVTVCTNEQKEAIAALVSQKMRESHTVDELARLIRPCIGLTKGDAEANAKYYDNVVATLKKDHPRMKASSIRKKALEASRKYAERQHRQRAFTIAQTESAFAYNRGADEGVRQAQEQRLLGECIKRWSTSGDDAVCEICASLEGTEIRMDEEFEFKGRVLFPGHKMLPPAHPRCACAIEYIEIGPPQSIPDFEIDPFSETDTREYSDEEIYDFANSTEDTINKYVEKPSKWSGILNIEKGGVKYQKEWDCSITTSDDTAPHIILHEQLHARSVSYFNEEIFNNWRNLEEASVTFAAQEISKTENIPIISSDYDGNAEILRIVCQRIDNSISDLEWSLKILEQDLPKRFSWISETLYKTMKNSGTIEEYEYYTRLLDILYEGG